SSEAQPVQDQPPPLESEEIISDQTGGDGEEGNDHADEDDFIVPDEAPVEYDGSSEESEAAGSLPLRAEALPDRMLVAPIITEVEGDLETPQQQSHHIARSVLEHLLAPATPFRGQRSVWEQEYRTAQGLDRMA